MSRLLLRMSPVGGVVAMTTAALAMVAVVNITVTAMMADDDGTVGNGKGGCAVRRSRR